MVEKITENGQTHDPGFYGVGMNDSQDGLVAYTTSFEHEDGGHLRDVYLDGVDTSRYPVEIRRSTLSLALGERILEALGAARPILKDHGLILTTFGPDGPDDGVQPILVTYSPRGAAPTGELLQLLTDLLPDNTVELLRFAPADVVSLGRVGDAAILA